LFVLCSIFCEKFKKIRLDAGYEDYIKQTKMSGYYETQTKTIGLLFHFLSYLQYNF